MSLQSGEPERFAAALSSDAIAAPNSSPTGPVNNEIADSLSAIAITHDASIPSQPAIALDDGILRGRSLTATLLWLSAPVIVEKFLVMLVGWSDTFLTGKFLRTPEYLAAITVSAYILWMLECCTAFVSVGVHAVVSRLVGGRQVKSANEIVVQSLYLSALIGIAIGALSIWLVRPLIAWVSEGSERELVVIFVRIVSLSCPFMMLTLTGTNALRAAGHTVPGMIIMGIVNFVNVLFSWLLCIGAASLPKMGWAGIATGTSLSFLVGAALAIAWLYVGHGEIRLPRAWRRIDGEAFVRMLRIGVPAAINMLTVVFFQLWFISIIKNVGEVSMAAHGVALRSESLSYLTAEAFSVAGATIVGQSLGARRPDLALRAGWKACWVGAVVLSLLGFVFFFAADWLFAIFVPLEEQGVYDVGVPVLKLVSFAMPALAAGIILSGALRGAGDTRGPLFYNTFGFCLVRIPLAYLLTSHWVGWGLFGAWTAMVCDLYVQSIFAIHRYRAAKWTAIRV